jgi:hypothetical protein
MEGSLAKALHIAGSSCFRGRFAGSAACAWVPCGVPQAPEGGYGRRSDPSTDQSRLVRRPDIHRRAVPEQVLLVEEVAERLRISTRMRISTRTVTRAIEAGRLVSHDAADLRPPDRRVRGQPPIDIEGRIAAARTRCSPATR